MTDKCAFCNNSLLPKEEINSRIYGKSVCNSAVCIDKANLEAKAAIDAAMSPRDKVLSYLARENFKEQGMAKGLFIQDGSNIAVDLRELPPKIGVLIGSEIQEENHGVLRVVDIRNTIEAMLKSKTKTKPTPEVKHDEKEHQKAKESKDAKAEEHKANAPEVKPEPKPQPKPVEVVAPEKVVHKPSVLIPARMSSPQGNYIKGLVPMMKEIGKIKIGSKGEVKTSGKGTQYRPPVKFDHFEIVSVLRDEQQNLIPDPVMNELGDKPKELDVFLLYNDETLNFTTRYNEYKGGKCQCSGDGVTARLINGDEIECNPETCKVFKEKRCKPNGILSVILTKSPRLGGVYKFRTTSYNSIRSILSSLFFIRSLTGGVLAMIPLKMTVSPMTVQPKDSATAQTIYVVNVEFAGTVQQLLEKTVEVSKYQSLMRGQIQELEITARMALCAPESEEEIKDIQAEFYPEKQEVK